MPLRDSRPLNPAGTGVALVSMPFAPADSPSIAIGLLKAALARDGTPCDDVYATLDFLDLAGAADYALPRRFGFDLLGDWVFAADFAGGDGEAYAVAIAKRHRVPVADIAPVMERARRLREDVVPKLFECLVEARDWGGYELVGLSSTFQQHAASLVFAKRLGERWPDLPVIVGGAWVKGSTGRAWLEGIEDIDYVCTGEGIDALPALVKALRDGGDLGKIDNIAWRRDGRIEATPERPASTPMDEQPMPDYGGYFDRLPEGRDALLPIETSKGCWWGEKNHCVFCSLNGPSMTYVAKSPERVLDELDTLSTRYRTRQFLGVDNIMARSFPDAVFRRLDEAGADLAFFFETKANLTLREIRTLRRGGVLHIQPGIESLSTPVLKLMRKGVSGIQNVFLLKWARYFDIKVSWNLLYSFHGETREHYARQRAWFPLLWHMDPPSGVDGIILERHSPMYADQAGHGVTRARVPWTFGHVFGGTGVDLERACHFFDHDADRNLTEADVEALRAGVRDWTVAARRGASLTVARYPSGMLEITDRRGPEPRVHRFDRPWADVYEAAGLSVTSAAKIGRAIGLDQDEVRRALDAFADAGLVLEEDGRVTALAVPESRRYWDGGEAILPQRAPTPPEGRQPEGRESSAAGSV